VANDERLTKIHPDSSGFPQKGIMFRDITTLLKDPEANKSALKQLTNFAKDLGVTKVVGIESRGFISARYLPRN